MRRTVLFFAWAQYDAAETEFWQELRRSLASYGLHLLIVSPNLPPAGFDVEHFAFVPTIDALWPSHDSQPISVAALGLDADALLAREQEWSGPTLVEGVRRLRRHALSAIALHAVRLLSAVQPVCALIWNGQHVAEMILDAALRHGRTPVLYVERAPVPRALIVDERGLSAASALAAEPQWPIPGEAWLRLAGDISARVAGGALTWWHQPGNRGVDWWRRELRIGPGRQVLLFAGQVDEDTQRFLFSPIFTDNLDAWQWLLQALAGRHDVFVLGKQHPKATMPPEAYRRTLQASELAGAWRSDVSIDDALAVADRVVAVNSTVLYEALARDLPVLALGDWLLKGRGVAHEVRSRESGTPVVDAWLADEGADARRRRWRECLGYLASRSIYAYEEEAVRQGSLGPRDLASRIAACASTAVWQPPSEVLQLLFGSRSTRPWRNLGDPDRSPSVGPSDEWQAAHTLRHCLLQARAAARRGRRVVIWGAGRAGRIVRELLADAGVAVAAFVSSHETPGHVDATPVIAPDGLETEPVRDFVVVASLAAAEIVPQLTGRDFRDGDDVVAIDCERLLDLTTPAARRLG